MGAELRYNPGQVPYTAAGALASGDVVVLPNTHTPGRPRIGIYQGLKSAEAGDVVSLATKGVYEFPADTTDAFAVGDTVWWEAGAGKIIDNATGAEAIAGLAVTAKSGGVAGTILVDINEAISDA